jgi:hypothetical protein
MQLITQLLLRQKTLNKKLNMKHIKLFESYVFEAANAESLETSEISNGVDTAEYLTSAKGESSDDRSSDKAYLADCKKFANSLRGKVFKVPAYGMISKATFKFGDFADCAFGAKGESKGAGVWNDSTRVQESKLEKSYYPTTFIAGYVSKDKEWADFDFNPSSHGAKKALKPGDEGYYGYLNIHRREGKELDVKTSPEKFTMQELVAVDPQWKSYFKGLFDIAAKYAK